MHWENCIFHICDWISCSLFYIVDIVVKIFYSSNWRPTIHEFCLV